MGTKHADLVRDALIEAGYPGTTTGQKAFANQVVVRNAPPGTHKSIKSVVRSVYRYTCEYTTPASGYLVIRLGK